MKHSRWVAAALALAPFCGGTAAPEPDAEKELAALRATYAQALAGIEAEYRAEAESAPTRYAEAIAALVAQKQKAGDLDGVLAATREKDRFAREKTLPRETDAGGGDLAAIQKRFIEAEASAATVKSNRVLDLIAKYTARLEADRKALTVGGKIDQAVLYDREIKKVRASPEAASAEFQLASAPPPPTPDPRQPPQGTEPDPPPDPAPRAASAPVPAIAGSSRAKLHAGIAPAIPDVHMKRMTLRPTPVVRVGASVAVGAMLGDKSSLERDSGAGVRSAYSTTSGSVSHHLRLTLRTRAADGLIERPMVIVQYFTRNAGKTSGRITPEQTSVETVNLTRLDAGQVTLDLPPLTLGQSSYSYRGPHSASSYEYGKEFYGFIVSVADADGKIVYQGSSIASLDDFGQTAMDEAGKDARVRELENARMEFEAAREAHFANMRDPSLRARFEAARERFFQLQGIPRPQRHAGDPGAAARRVPRRDGRGERAAAP